jgi:nicotinamidase-related amidase
MEINAEIKEIINPNKTALLVWDVQNMLVRNIFNTEQFLSNSKNIVSLARAKKIPVFFSKITPLPENFESPARKYRMKHSNFKLNPEGDGLNLTIEPLKNEMVIPKNTASIFIGTNFELLLRNAGISTIVFVGIATEMGIESSARDAINRGFFSVIVTDAVSSYNQDAHMRSLENLKTWMILLNAEEIASIWQ